MNPLTQVKFSPPSFEHLEPKKLALEVDRHLPRLFQMHANLAQTAITATTSGNGFGFNSGNEIITGSKLGIPTGLATVQFVTASVSTGSTPNAYTTSAGPSATVSGGIDIYVFQPTSNVDTTPIAATAAVLIHWHATGITKGST